jgi:hypothetical protein
MAVDIQMVIGEGFNMVTLVHDRRRDLCPPAGRTRPHEP